MAIDLNSISRAVSGPPRIVLYGVPGIGKTSWAAAAPSPVFIPVEDGCGELNVQAFPKPETYAQVLECIGALVTGTHDYETVVIDSLDKLEPLLWADVCQQAGKKNIEEFGYGKGYAVAAAEWRNLLGGLDALRARGMQVILLAHSTVARIEPPETDPYDRYQLRLHKSAEATICDWADAVLFANYKVTTVSSGGQGSERRRGVSDGSRVVHTTERAAWRAKNRYRLPDQMPLEYAAFAAATKKTQPATTSVAS